MAIVTGASRGIGAAAASVFAERGASVVLAARDEEALTAVAEAIERGGGTALPVPTDVRDAAAVEQLVRRTVDAFGVSTRHSTTPGAGTSPRRWPIWRSRTSTARSM